jgi:anti-sigma-K factor RskA
MTRTEQVERAGDYVLGLLEGAELEAFEAAMAADAELAATVARLQSRMTALDDTAIGTADPALWARIEAKVSALPQAVAANENRKQRAPVPRWAAVAASVVVGIGAGYFVGLSMPGDTIKPTMIAVLINEANASPGAIIEAFGDNSVRIVPLEQFSVPAGSVLQVWTLPDAETGPVSLGTLDGPLDTRLRGPDLPAPLDGQLYEITLEPAPGSPTGKPTGPILVKGFAKAPI